MIISDFSGGITDNSRLGVTNQAEELDNFIVNDENGLTKRAGSYLFDSNIYRIYDQVPTSHIFEDQDNMFICAGRDLYRIYENSFGDKEITRLVGPSLGKAFNIGDENTKYSHSVWQKHILLTNDDYSIPVKAFIDENDNWKLVSAGLPKVDETNITFTPSAGTGADTYLYAMCYFYQYNVGTVTYEDFGACIFLSASSDGPIGANSMLINGIPELTNNSGFNYDLTNIKIKIYRTESTGSAFYEITELANGVTSYLDTTDDTSLLGGASLYEQGGIVGNDQPPLSKYNMIVENTAYYCNVKENDEEKGFRIRLSKTNDIDSCPAASYKDFDSDITGCSNIRNLPIVFAKDRFWRLDGVFAEDGSGSVIATLVSSTVGCVSNNSIVKLDSGLVFASNKGFAYTDGYRCFLLSNNFNKRYKKLIATEDRARQIYGTYDNLEGLIYWACQLDDTSKNNDSLFVMHEKKGTNTNACFTIWNNKTNFQPIAVMVNSNNELIRGDSRGLIFKHSYAYRADMKIDLTVSDPKEWNNAHIPFRYISTNLFTDNKDYKKLGGYITLRAKNISDLSLLLSSANNSYKNFGDMPEVRRRDGIVWEKPYVYWEDAGYEWENTEDIEETRNFPSGGQMRFFTKQIRIQPSWTEIESSSERCTAEVDITTTPFTVELTSTDFKWDDECVDYWIYFEDDNYEQGYLITSREDDQTIRIATPINPPTTGEKNWVIRGHNKKELLELVSYSVNTQVIGDKARPYTGENNA